MTLIRFTILTTAFVALARGDHTITFINDCNFAVTPMWKDNSDGASNHQINTLAPGSRGSTSLPEFWQSGRLFAQDPVHSCALPDGGGCTLVECNFGPGNPRFWQCNLSLVSGYNIPTAYKFVGGNETSCTGFSCTSAHCPMTEAYLPSGCDGCINQCNTDNVDLQITYCQQGSTLPAFAPKPAPAPAPSKAQPAPAPGKSQPAPAPAPPKANPAPAPAKSNPAPAPNSSAPENVVAAPTPTSPPSEASSPSAQPSSASKHCPRSSRKARRAHQKRRMHMLEFGGNHNA